MWKPVDPEEPTSELYRLMPPRKRRSELREALDVATGADLSLADTAGEAEPGVSGTPAAATRSGRRRVASFLGGVIVNALGGILSAGVVALIVYLWVHFH